MVAFTDSSGTPLSGGANYSLTLPPDIPAANFWSLTLYEAENASGLANGQPFPSLGSRDKPAQERRRLDRPLSRPRSTGRQRGQLARHGSRQGLLRDPPALQPDGGGNRQELDARRHREDQLSTEAAGDALAMATWCLCACLEEPKMEGRPMKVNLIAASLVVAVATTGAAYGQTSPQVPFPASPSEVTQPATGVLMHPEYAKAIARTAYVWGWPMVNMMNRRAAITQAPEPGRLNGVLPAAPRGQIAMLSDYIDPGQTFVTCPNQDVVYGLGFFSLDEEPVVIQVPDFGDRFWIYALYDARTDQFAQIGKPYATEPGFYLLAGPNWNGTVPAGIAAVVRSSTELANVIPRVFMDDTDEDRAAIQSVIDQIVAYPLTDFDGTMKTKDWSEAPEIPGPKSEGGGETAWVVPEKFFDQLGGVLDTVAPLPGEEAMYAQFRALLDAAAKDDAIKQALVEAAVETERDVIAPFFDLATQWSPRRQWLEPFDQQRAVRRRLLQPYRHGEVEHVRQQADRNAVLLHRQ